MVKDKDQGTITEGWCRTLGLVSPKGHATAHNDGKPAVILQPNVMVILQARGLAFSLWIRHAKGQKLYGLKDTGLIGDTLISIMGAGQCDYGLG